MIVAFAVLEPGKDPELGDATFDEESVYLVFLFQRRNRFGSVDDVGEPLEWILERHQFLNQLVSFLFYGHVIESKKAHY